MIVLDTTVLPDLAPPLLGALEEVCLVTPDLERSAAGLMRLGIGPWKIMEINPQNTTDQTYRGRLIPFTIRVGFAEASGIVWELMQPMDANSIFAEHLTEKGEGLHHLSFAMDGLPWSDRTEAMTARGFPPVQTGLWMGGPRFAFFDTEAATGMSFETYRYPEGWQDPPGSFHWWPHTSR